MSNEAKDAISMAVFLSLGITSVALWGFIAGQLSVSVRPSSTLRDVHRAYLYITIHEDGSYEGENVGGTPVIGCILQAPCHNNIQPATGGLQ